MMRLHFILATIAATLIARTPALSQPAPAADPYLWLESIEGPKALEWVERQNTRSLGLLKSDPRYSDLHAAALKIVEAPDRIPLPELIGPRVYNFWQDSTHVRGLWRRTSRQSFTSASPDWEDVIDLDALSTVEKANWVWHGVTCLPPEHRFCLVSLSDGGEDATRVRQFDLKAKAFVPGGFDLSRSKQTVDWLDADTLIMTRDWGGGTLTASGYGFVVKTLKSGQSLAQATEVFRGQPADVSVDPVVLSDGRGNSLALIQRATDFFHTETYRVTGAGVVRLALPQKIKLLGLLGGKIILKTDEAWALGARSFTAGSLLAADPDHLGEGQVQLIYQPGPRQSVEAVAVTADRVVAEIYDNVRGGLASFSLRDDVKWQRDDLPVAANASVNLISTADADNALYYTVEGFLQPTHLFSANAARTGADDLKALAARFDADNLMVEQFETFSSDGTKIPYFVVHKANITLDGSNPTLLYAYGGFQVSMLPSYSGAVGKLWLERGGVYVLANIRGGGEFGPAWHEAGLKTHRQIIYDDFAAVGRDLIARKITSPRRLGIEGGSNGGLLMGVEMTQHPELWQAVVIQVPLLDMLRFEQIGAGASWVGEYGSVSVPEEERFLAGISPYHNLKPHVAYPMPFFVTSTKDDRVTPVHARKMAARMQEMGLPFLYFENTNGGHAASANQQERAERIALEFTYLVRQLFD